MTYTLVSEAEANLREGKMSIGTPIAKGLIGKRKGDVVPVTTPSGVIEFEIVDLGI
jgi:transcription elongation factor GreA